uniref:Uncharacterized protein n=1 Tax=Onchocerca volvulus TaxID=6282 RepID=A0A8R1XP05_ONCVO
MQYGINLYGVNTKGFIAFALLFFCGWELRTNMDGVFELMHVYEITYFKFGETEEQAFVMEH